MKRLLILFLLCAASAYGQLTPAPSSTGNITTNAANCNTTNACIILHMATSNVGYSVTVSGSWTGTLTVEQSGDNQGSWTSATTTTINTLYTSALTPGITDVRVRGSAAMTGTAVITITASGPATIQQITGSGSAASLAGNANDTYLSPYCPSPFSGNCYFVNANALFVCDASWANSSSTVTIQNDANLTDPVFTSAMIGWMVWGTNEGCVAPVNNADVKVPKGTITAVNSGTSITVSTTSTAVCTSSTGNPVCTLVFGPADDAANIQAGWNAVLAAGKCGTLHLPQGIMLVGSAIVSSVKNCAADNTQNNGASGSQVVGQGQTSTILIPIPLFNAAGCTSPSNACFFSNGNTQSNGGIKYRDFTIYGGGCINAANCISNSSGKTALYVGQNGIAENIGVNQWGIPTAFVINGTNAAVAIGRNLQTMQSGGTGITIGGSVLGWGPTAYCYFCNSTWHIQGQSLNVGNGWSVTIGGTYSFGASGNGTVQVQPGGHWTSYGETALQAQTNNQDIVRIEGISDIHAGHFVSETGGVTGVKALHVISTGIANVSSSVIDSTQGTGIGVAVDSGGIYRDLGGNTGIPSSTTPWSVAAFGGIVADGHSLVGTCTGVATASQTLGLYGTGPNETLTTCTSTTIGSGIILPQARTLQNLVVSSTAGGVNGSSGVVTVLQNGSPTTITCTLGTTTFCADGLHTVVGAAGDLISIRFTTQAAETLAGVKAQVIWN